MSGLLPNVDPQGLLEYSVVFTDRALNHMSQSFQGVMRDISATLKQVYNARSAIVVPGSGTFGMEAVARQFATGKKCLVIRNGWFSYRWTPDLRHGRHSGADDRAQGASHRRRLRRRRLRRADRRSRGHHQGAEARRGLCAARRDQLRHDPAGRLSARGRRCRARRSAACSCSIASRPARSGWTWSPAAWTC